MLRCCRVTGYINSVRPMYFHHEHYAYRYMVVHNGIWEVKPYSGCQSKSNRELNKQDSKWSAGIRFPQLVTRVVRSGTESGDLSL